MKCKVGDTLITTREISFPNGSRINKGIELKVTDIGMNYGLPFVFSEELGKEVQLQLSGYKLKEVKK